MSLRFLPKTFSGFLLTLVCSLVLVPECFASPKKGFGLPERHGWGAERLRDLKVNWFYNWGSKTAIKDGTPFVPMIFSSRDLKAQIAAEFILGYNEPDNPKQANLPVDTALKTWSEIAAKGRYVGSPAMAGNPLTKEWLKEFFKRSPKVHFVAVHWYKGPDSKHFIRDMEEIHQHFRLPIWVTEFAPQTAESSRENPEKFSQSSVELFIQETTDWMERTPWIQRYAWHDSKTGTSALFDSEGKLTASGKKYAEVK